MGDFRHISEILSEVVSRLNQSKQRGDELWCHCPFHNDRHPSFSVNTESGAWYCFTCAEGGSIYQLANRLGIKTGKLNLNPTTKTKQLSPLRLTKRIEEAFDHNADAYTEKYRIGRNKVVMDLNEGRIDESEFYYRRQIIEYKFDCKMEIHDEIRNRLTYEAKHGN